MKDKQIIIGTVIATFIILSVGIVLVGSLGTPQITATENAKAAILSQKSYDFGKVAYNGAKVQKTYIIKNSGTEILKLYNIKTSCHCTKAYATTPDGSESPYFGMSGVSSWVGEVSPGGQAKITAIFDPTYHGLQGAGPVIRYISVETNDKSNSKLTFTLAGIVTK